MNQREYNEHKALKRLHFKTVSKLKEEIEFLRNTPTLDLRLPQENPCLSLNTEEMLFFKSFLQGMLNRRIVGGMRYGAIQSKKKYLTRLKKTLNTYSRAGGGNMEHLLDIAVYSYLEAYAPEHKNFHWNPNSESTTRGEMG